MAIQLYGGKILTADGKVASHEDCCCCGCTCENCLDTAPCCFKVVIADMAEGTCGDCADLNKTYYLPQISGTPCTWKLTDVCTPFACDPTEMTLEVLLDGSDYKIRVTLGEHIWEKNYGEDKPDCCSLVAEALTHTTSGGDCDSSSATCAITASDEECPTDCCDDYCLNGEAPDTLKIVIAGMVGGGGISPCTTARCGECADGTFYVPLTAPCIYSLTHCGDCDSGSIKATLYKVGSNYKLSVEIGDPGTDHKWIKYFGTTVPDCLNLSSESLTLDTDGDEQCSSASATCLVSSAHGATPTSDTRTGVAFCLNCGDAPEQVMITIDGVVNRVGLRFACGCIAGGAELYNNSYVLDRDGCNFSWNYVQIPDSPPATWCGSIVLSDQGGGVARVRVRMGTNCGCVGVDYVDFEKTFIVPIDCRGWNNLDIPLDIIPGPGWTAQFQCIWINATCKLTSL